LVLSDAFKSVLSPSEGCYSVGIIKRLMFFFADQHIIFKNLSRAHESHDHDEESSKDMVYWHGNAQALFCLSSIHLGGSLVVVIPDGLLMYNLCC
jgi:hypothetical protein